MLTENYEVYQTYYTFEFNLLKTKPTGRYIYG